MRLRLFDGLAWHSSELDRGASRERDEIQEEAKNAAARQECMLEIMSTAARLTAEWDESDRIDRIVRLAARLDEARRPAN